MRPMVVAGEGATLTETDLTSDDTLLASSGDDVLNGGYDDDTLWASTGADTLDGGNGTDHCDGGKDNDTDTATNCETANRIP